jgi:hypothetical protein
MTGSTVTHKMTALEPPSQPELESQRQLRPKRSLPRKSSAGPNSLSDNNSNAAQGVRTVIKQLGTVSIVKESVASSTAGVALTPSQPPSQSARRPVAQAIVQTKGNFKSSNYKVGAGSGRDEKVDPSPASGGIPDPTKEYLRACLSSPSQLREPQHLLIVIDLNGTLLYRPNKKRPQNFHMRPHAQSFLKYCVTTFTVVIWSSARPENVAAMCNTILTPEIRSRVAAIWGRDKFGLTKADYDLRVQCYKRLSKLWQAPNIAASHPMYHQGYRWNQQNTVLIDDSREKARTEPHNLIEVPEWFGDLHERDDILPQVHDYLNHLSMHSNVSACLKSHPWRPTVF